MANPTKYSFDKISRNEPGDKGSDKKRVFMSVYVPSHPDLVQQHLNTGVLVRMINDLYAKRSWHSLCLLVACAMQLGCNIPDWCREELTWKYKKCHLSPDGEVSFGKALRDYRNGTPYPFNSEGLDCTIYTGNSYYDKSEIAWMALEDVPAGEESPSTTPLLNASIPISIVLSMYAAIVVPDNAQMEVRSSVVPAANKGEYSSLCSGKNTLTPRSGFIVPKHAKKHTMSDMPLSA